MPNYQVAFNNTTKTATIQAKGDALPGGSVKIGEFEHANVEANINDLEFDVNHVFYHHVRDLLYKRSAANPANTAMFPNNITDMAGIKIEQDVTYVALVSINIGADAGVNVAGPTHQIVVTPTPGDASNTAVTYVSSNPAVATVSPTGLVTRVANGTTNITATSVDGGHTDVKVITATT